MGPMGPVGNSLISNLNLDLLDLWTLPCYLRCYSPYDSLYSEKGSKGPMGPTSLPATRQQPRVQQVNDGMSQIRCSTSPAPQPRPPLWSGSFATNISICWPSVRPVRGLFEPGRWPDDEPKGR
jgi:hypothetical protein